MTTLTMAVTVEAAAAGLPARAKIVVTDTGTPFITLATVVRLDPSGALVPVRTDNGAPLTLVTSGTTRVGTIYDYETPYGQAVSYSTTQRPGTVSSAVTVNETRATLIHPGVPARSVYITLVKGSFDEEEEDVSAGVFKPIGRRNAVVITDGRRKAPSGEFIVETTTSAERTALRELLADAFPLLLNVPPSLGIDVDTSYVHIGTLRRARPSDVGSSLLRHWKLPFQVVDMPVGGAQSVWTYASVVTAIPTYASLLANTTTYPTYADMQAPTN